MLALGKPHIGQGLDTPQAGRRQVIKRDVAIKVGGIYAHTFHVVGIFAALPWLPSGLHDRVEDVGVDRFVLAFAGSWATGWGGGGGGRHRGLFCSVVEPFRKDDFGALE